jgi:hypothetical protein
MIILWLPRIGGGRELLLLSGLLLLGGSSSHTIQGRIILCLSVRASRTLSMSAFNVWGTSFVEVVGNQGAMGT